MFEAVFAAVCVGAYRNGAPVSRLDSVPIGRLKADAQFANAASTKSTNRANVDLRLQRAREILLGA